MKYFFICVVCIITIACGSKDENSKNGSKYLRKAEIKYVRDIRLKLDSNTTPVTSDVECIVNSATSEERIAFLNESMNSIQFYDFSGEKDNEIFFQKEGPNSTGTVQGFYYLNKDSIFVLDNRASKVFIVTSQGKKVDSYSLPNPTARSFYTLPWIENGKEMFFHEKSLYIPGNCGEDYDAKGRENFYSKGFLSIVLNITKNEVNFEVPYPNLSWIINKHYPPQAIRPFRIINKNTNELVYSFGCDNNVYSMSLNGSNLKKHFVASRYVKSDLEQMSSSVKFNDSNECFFNYINNFYYSKMYYDKYNNLYYRLVKHPIETEYTKEDLLMKKLLDIKYSLIICDSNFDILNEVMLSEGLGLGSILISKQGILFEKNSGNEDTSLFELFKVTHN